MSLNFPTAFWKQEAPPVGVGTSIDWNTSLWWSHDDDPEELFVLRDTSSFPFNVDVAGAEQEYYYDYDTYTTFENPLAFYGWYLDGGPDDANPAPGKNDLSDYHRANSWIIQPDGLDVQLYYEADWDTAMASGINNGSSAINVTKYNHFIQSGEATGSFTLEAQTNLEIKVSGLAHDIFGNTTDENNYNQMLLYLYNGSSEELVCSGCAPMDDRWSENAYPLASEVDLYGSLIENIDMQQVKLYAGGALNTIVNSQQTPTVDASKGQPRSNSGEFVKQLTRYSYCNNNGIGTFNKNNLAAGSYELRLRSFTADGATQSGAFYGFTFSFS